MIDFSSEIKYKTARSGGKGGQNVNKVETMVEARWNIIDSRLFPDEAKAKLFESLANHINGEGILVVKSSESRSQLENKEIVTKKILQIVHKCLVPKKKRVATKPSKATVEKRLDHKKQQAERKQSRKKDWE
ncbi:aminoacyl-tRNA hydrolase [Taibaiella sp. KBW10]|uniref:alternative ribosome rescue aminoacyl-tRNA hydrolase ArfB n=1 Tax=Taibaiella sp. KBW10 TaxID=2153357 RepID=UPI000F59B16B|nr:alternative ribosome rescue aminoacyl-tRNA hydrolase ArfB [Taibaiella sp. KBW10]RQO30187.1 aminoacyl-tRNA hydrolase [Taibaiella sp. KBW10]